MTNADAAGQTPGTLELNEIYARRFARSRQRRGEVWVALNRFFFQKWVNPRDTILDLGAGHCEFINPMQAGVKLALAKFRSHYPHWSVTIALDEILRQIIHDQAHRLSRVEAR
ncbi:MAG TPA: hypothetical protein VNO32_56525 [Candidatus Acidoferrum sp.]|nr:hypothetical protein [Candidatus Acidoferrum sp.]